MKTIQFGFASLSLIGLAACGQQLVKFPVDAGTSTSDGGHGAQDSMPVTPPADLTGTDDASMVDASPLDGSPVDASPLDGAPLDAPASLTDAQAANLDAPLSTDMSNLLRDAAGSSDMSSPMSLLGAAESFAVLGGSTVTNTGGTIVYGNLGISPGQAVTGFPPGQIIGGSVYVGAAGPAGAAQSALTTAYNNLAARACGTNKTGVDLGGKTLAPGVYCFDSSTGATVGGVLTLDGQGNPNAVFVFQIGSTLTFATGARVVAINGANPCNVYWQIGSSATIGLGAEFGGSILAQASITLMTGANVSGRALARTGAVTLDTNSVANAVCGQPSPLTDGGTGPDMSVAPDAGGGGARKHELYVLTSSFSGTPRQTNLEVLDIDAGKRARGVYAPKGTSLTYRNGRIYVTEGTPSPRIQVLDPDTLLTLDTIPLAAVSNATVFNADGSIAYSVDSDGKLRKIVIATKATAWALVIPDMPSNTTHNLTALALSPDETLVGVTGTNNTNPSQSTVVNVAGMMPMVKWSTVNPSMTQGTAAVQAIFTPNGSELIVWDADGPGFYSFKASDGTSNTAATTLFTGTAMTSTDVPSIGYDANGSYWSSEINTLYRGNQSDTTQRKAFPQDPSAVLGIVFDAPKTTGYTALRTMAGTVFSSLNPSTGVLTPLAWNLSGYAEGSWPAIVYVAR